MQILSYILLLFWHQHGCVIMGKDLFPYLKVPLDVRGLGGGGGGR